VALDAHLLVGAGVPVPLVLWHVFQGPQRLKQRCPKVIGQHCIALVHAVHGRRPDAIFTAKGGKVGHLLRHELTLSHSETCQLNCKV
jgi:hypothetical protein